MSFATFIYIFAKKLEEIRCNWPVKVKTVKQN